MKESFTEFSHTTTVHGSWKVSLVPRRYTEISLGMERGRCGTMAVRNIGHAVGQVLLKLLLLPVEKSVELHECILRVSPQPEYANLMTFL